MTKINYTDEQEQFIATALKNIDENPISRLSKVTKDALIRNNFVFDAHAHVFDGKCIDPKYFVIRALGRENNPRQKQILEFLVGLLLDDNEKGMDFTADYDAYIDKLYSGEIKIKEKDIDELTKKIIAKNILEQSNKAIENVDLNGILQRISDILAILRTGKMSDVYNTFVDKYAINKVVTGKELITIVLGMDIQSGWDGSIIKSYKEQTEELAALSKIHPIIPFLPLHPKRAGDPAKEHNELYDAFLDAFNKDKPKFFGVKIYPSLGYLPSDKALQPIFKICAERNIPIVTHCGGEMVSTFKQDLKVNRFGVIATIRGTRKEIARQLNEPEEWREVLEFHPNLHINLGHFGGHSAWREENYQNNKRIKFIIDRMHNSKSKVYTDFSYNLNDPLISQHFAASLHGTDHFNNIIKERCMFGTDFWVVVPQSDLIDDQKHFIELIGDKKEALLKDNVLSFLGLDSIKHPQ